MAHIIDAGTACFQLDTIFFRAAEHIRPGSRIVAPAARKDALTVTTQTSMGTDDWDIVHIETRSLDRETLTLHFHPRLLSVVRPKQEDMMWAGHWQTALTAGKDGIANNSKVSVMKILRCFQLIKL